MMYLDIHIHAILILIRSINKFYWFISMVYDSIMYLYIMKYITVDTEQFDVIFEIVHIETLCPLYFTLIRSR